MNKKLQNTAMEVLTEEASIIDQDELTGQTLILLDGKPIVTTDSLATERKKIFEANPQLEQVFAHVDPEQFDKNIAEALLNQAIVDRYIGEKGLDKTADYKKELKEAIKAVERMVNTKFFMQNIPVNLTDASIRAFYDENKSQMPELIAMSKEEAKYASFEQVKDRLKEHMEKDVRSKKFEEEMAALKKRYNVEIKDDFLTALEGE